MEVYFYHEYINVFSCFAQYYSCIRGGHFLFLIDFIKLSSIGYGIQGSIRSLGNVPKTLLFVIQQSLLSHYAIIFQNNSGNMVTIQLCDEKVVFPFRNSIAGIKNHTAW